MYENQYIIAMIEHDTDTMAAIERLNNADPRYYDASSRRRDTLRAMFGSAYDGCPGIDYTPKKRY